MCTFFITDYVHAWCTVQQMPYFIHRWRRYLVYRFTQYFGTMLHCENCWNCIWNVWPAFCKFLFVFTV